MTHVLFEFDRHDWPVRLLLRAHESKALEVESEMKGRSLLLYCCSLGRGLPFVPNIVLQEKIMMQFCRRKKCTHYGLVAEIYLEGVESSWMSNALEIEVAKRYFNVVGYLVSRYEVSVRTSISACALCRRSFPVIVFSFCHAQVRAFCVNKYYVVAVKNIACICQKTGSRAADHPPVVMVFADRIAFYRHQCHSGGMIV